MSGKIRKLKVKRIGSRKWQWLHTAEMTFDEAIQTLGQAVDEDPTIYAVRIDKLGGRWTEEFSGDREFNYIGVEV